MNEVIIVSSANELEAFKETPIWTDFVNELRSWKEGFELERASIVEKAAEENLTTANVLMHIGDINGRIKAVDYLLNLPDILKGVLEGQQELSNNQEETNDE